MLYVVAAAISIVAPIVAVLIDIGVGAMWIIPDRRLERRMNQSREEHGG
jgi:hypothetical protein